jgi:oligopeptide/dipeptide ABC transporter ATP-binding protein
MSSASANSALAGPLLEIRDLHVWFDTDRGRVHAVRGVSLSVAAGTTLGIVGESGCGKSVTCHAVLRLAPANAHTSGTVAFAGRDLATADERSLESIRGREIAMIFQEPSSALNPVHPIGSQIVESLRLHRALDAAAAQAEALRLLERVGIPEPARRLREYPHQLSGGMNQRAMIAMALACRPKLLLADEPTTALDVTIQAQILELLQALQLESGMGMVLVTHDLGVVAETADQVAVMYAGQVVERASAAALFAQPLHPYTEGLLHALPRIDLDADRLEPIEGTLPSALVEPPGCAFAPRCARATGRCRVEAPRLTSGISGRAVACHFPLDGSAAAA